MGPRRNSGFHPAGCEVCRTRGLGSRQGLDRKYLGADFAVTGSIYHARSYGSEWLPDCDRPGAAAGVSSDAPADLPAAEEQAREARPAIGGAPISADYDALNPTEDRRHSTMPYICRTSSQTLMRTS